MASSKLYVSITYFDRSDAMNLCESPEEATVDDCCWTSGMSTPFSHVVDFRYLDLDLVALCRHIRRVRSMFSLYYFSAFEALRFLSSPDTRCVTGLHGEDRSIFTHMEKKCETIPRCVPCHFLPHFLQEFITNR